jgi:alpha-D-ribose 1-methylphosphonate 5-triphosphate synthase subunit PhnI
MSPSRVASRPSITPTRCSPQNGAAIRPCPRLRSRRLTSSFPWLYDRELAALVIKQARGDLIEAIFLVRAYRTTLQRFGDTVPLDTNAIELRRRISAVFKDLPGGQILGPTFDYTHRLIDFSLAENSPIPERPSRTDAVAEPAPRVTSLLDNQGLIERNPSTVDTHPTPDLTRDPLTFPASRALCLQALSRGDEGFLLALGYSTQRAERRHDPLSYARRLRARHCCPE